MRRAFETRTNDPVSVRLLIEKSLMRNSISLLAVSLSMYAVRIGRNHPTSRTLKAKLPRMTQHIRSGEGRYPMYRKRSRWWLSLALAASTPARSTLQVSRAMRLFWPVVSFTTATWICLHLQAHSNPSPEERIDVARIQEQLHQGWNVVARSLDDASNRLLSTFEYARSCRWHLASVDDGNLPEDSKTFGEIAKAPSEALLIETSRPSHNPRKVCHQVPIRWSSEYWAWDHADYVECDDDRFNVDPPKPVLAHDDYVHRIIDEEL